jgi:hypothetical protein
MVLTVSRNQTLWNPEILYGVNSISQSNPNLEHAYNPSTHLFIHE